MITIMYDGINTDAEAIHQHAPAAPIACYINGAFAWSPAQEAMFARKIRISVEPGQPSAARYARVLDVERGDARPADVPAFLAERDKVSPNGTIYCSLAAVPDVLRVVDVRLSPRWWLAWYWGRPGAPSAAQVLAELERLTGELIPAADLWACQYVANVPLPGGACDKSVVYGLQDWSR